MEQNEVLGISENAKNEVKILVEKYQKIVEEKRISKYNEEMTKAEFIEPLFETLGWDIRNKHHKDEVTREEQISKDRVDYSFRINGIPKFFLEAKPLKANLDDPKYVEQAIHYAWNKGCTWAVLTDFEAVKIFNAEWRTTSYSQNHIKTIPCYEFLDRFSELWLLSKDSFEKGLLDKEAEKWGKKTKKSPVDKQLLSDFTYFREILSKSITKLNQSKNISQEDLDESIQRILDRLIFIRNCEDRGLEERQLISNLRVWEDKGKGQLVKNLREVFNYFDKLYNGKIFIKHLCTDLEIDNEVLHEVIEGLYYTKDKSISYDFSAIEADVLGNIYEQYLGHILKKTAKRATLTESQTHRKEQGIFYTPIYIVDYIVKNTLGKLLENKKIDPNKIRVLDPACGSGSFLIKTFDVLNNYYLKHDKNYTQTHLDASAETGTYAKKLNILKNNIFGVDLDKQAVDVAQLNLLLKVTEKGQRLPLLQRNIKQGNSLVSKSFEPNDKPFDWNVEFSEIMNSGRFDIIIGNPPYVRPHNLEPEFKQYLWKNYTTFKAKSDLYNTFMERGINLLKHGGLFSFIVPVTWTSLESFYEIRKYILETCKIVKLVQLPKKVFQDATVETCIFILSKESEPKKRENNEIIIENLSEAGTVKLVRQYKQSNIRNNHLLNFELYAVESGNKLLEMIKKKGVRLSTLVEFSYGLKTADDEKFIFTIMKNKDCKKLLKSKDIGKYKKEFCNNYVWYVPDLMVKNKKTARPGDKERFENEKIIVARMGKKIVAAYDNEKYFVKDAMLLLKKSESIDLRYLTAILNSNLINYFYGNYFITIDVLKNALLEMPIVLADPEIRRIVSDAVKKIEENNSKLNKIGNALTDERQLIEDEIKKIDAEINEHVYSIYGLTENEIQTIKENLKK